MACTQQDEDIYEVSRIEFWVSENKFVVAEGSANAQTTDYTVSVQIHAIAIDGDTLSIDVNEVYPVDSIVPVPDSAYVRLICPWAKYTHYISGDCSILKTDYTAQVDRIDLGVNCKDGPRYSFIVIGTLLK